MGTICTNHAVSPSLDQSTRFLCKEGRLNEAVNMLHNFHDIVNSSTYVYLLQCCIQKKALQQGKRIHSLILNHNDSRFREDVFLQNILLTMYYKCGILVDARNVFDEMRERDVYSWSIMIAAYNRQGFSEEALSLFQQMQQHGSGVQPNEFIFASVIPACATSASLAECVDMHRKVIRSGFHYDAVVVSALIDMYAKFGKMHKARVLFDKMKHKDAISWTAMVAGYAQNGLLDEAEKYFKQMHYRDTISWTAMIAGYAQNGRLDEAEKLFKEMPQRNIISWNAMIMGYAQNGHGLEAFKCFQTMQLTGLRTDSVTYVSIIPVCATFAALERGTEIHGKIIRNGCLSLVKVMNALIDMYAKCGSIQKACVLFDKMHCRDTTSWNAMIGGYAMHGFGKEAIKLFEQMELLGMSPDHITLLSVLTACSHAGLVDEGHRYFRSMTEYYGITPAMEHCVCMVDLLGRAGRLNEAKDFVNNMPIKPNADVWTCLLCACRTHNDIKVAEFVAEHILELHPESSLPYVLISNIYAMSGRWNEIDSVRRMMKDRGIRKIPGCSWIEVDKQVHTFVVETDHTPKHRKFMQRSKRCLM